MSLEAPGLADFLRSASSRSPNERSSEASATKQADEEEAVYESVDESEPPTEAQELSTRLAPFRDEEDYFSTSEDLGFYPDIEDPEFVARLLHKTEFADTKSEPFDPKVNPCSSGADFEVTPVQRFIANFMHPRTPYMSALLYHGVGVGKTCAAIQSAEAYLDIYPKKKVIIVCPRAIRPGFYRTIFDSERLVIGSGTVPNSASGCTASTYLRLADCLMERNRELIEKRITRAINRRYAFFGYGEFANYIRQVIQKVGDVTKNNTIKVATAIKQEFNNRLLIIDEAHNLRDVSGTAAERDEKEDIDTQGDVDDRKGAKQLTPFLKQLLDYSDGMKLLLMTATPMFNSVFEIHFLLNLMLMNEKKDPIAMSTILNLDGSPSATAETVLKKIANGRVSFMRGENPNSFPLRLAPEGKDPAGGPINRLTESKYPSIALNKDLKDPVSPESAQGMARLPIVLSTDGDAKAPFSRALRTITVTKVKERGTGYQTIDGLLQAGNCLFPTFDQDSSTGPTSGEFGKSGFDSIFTKDVKNSFTASNADWMLEPQLRNWSPKLATVLRYLTHAEGVGFVYSRFVTTGALLLALILEANGYTPYLKKRLLSNGIQDGKGRQCALCPKREVDHPIEGHDFRAATYVLLTGDPTISPQNNVAIKAARGLANVNGEMVKVVLGSQIAGEGLDLRFIREVHVLDAWFHLNKTEQIIGRGIRFCSHSMLPLEKRNTTVFLHCVIFPKVQGVKDIETADLACYRSALSKAIQVGQISQLLKRFSVDCNLRKDVLFLTENMGYRQQLDSQRQPRTGEAIGSSRIGPGVPLRDTDYSAICDWMECPKDFVCDPSIEIKLSASDDSTFDTFSAQFSETRIKKQIATLFQKQPYWLLDRLYNILVQYGYTSTAVVLTLQQLINNRLFRFTVGNQEGYLIYKNKYVLFQPDAYSDLKVPMALRIAAFPIKQDHYEPKKHEVEIVPTSAAAEGAPGRVVESLYGSFWNNVVGWMSSLAYDSERETDDLIDEISQYVEEFTGGLGTATGRVLIDKLSTLTQARTMIPDEEDDTFFSIGIAYLWDTLIPQDKQADFVFRRISGLDDRGVEGIERAASEQLIQDGSIKAYRWIDTQTNLLQYTCENGAACPTPVREVFERKDEPVKKRVASVTTTGKPYGYLVAKRGQLVFKTQDPHSVGGKPDRGQECAIRTAKGQTEDKLQELGEILDTEGESIEGLDKVSLSRSDIRKNNTKGCTLLELVLRYMDVKLIQEKRWFFRPLAAWYAKHPALVSLSVSTALKEAAEEQKKFEREVTKKEKKDAQTQKKALEKVGKEDTKEGAAPPKTTRKPKAAAVAAEVPVVEATKPTFIRRKLPTGAEPSKPATVPPKPSPPENLPPLISNKEIEEELRQAAQASTAPPAPVPPAAIAPPAAVAPPAPVPPAAVAPPAPVPPAAVAPPAAAPRTLRRRPQAQIKLENAEDVL